MANYVSNGCQDCSLVDTSIGMMNGNGSMGMMGGMTNMNSAMGNNNNNAFNGNAGMINSSNNSMPSVNQLLQQEIRKSAPQNQQQAKMANTPNPIVKANVPPASKVEHFQNTGELTILTGIHFMFISLVVLAINEAIKFYIGNSIKHYDASPMYYVYYVAGAIIGYYAFVKYGLEQ
jgi:hypothetical protein